MSGKGPTYIACSKPFCQYRWSYAWRKTCFKCHCQLSPTTSRGSARGQGGGGGGGGGQSPEGAAGSGGGTGGAGPGGPPSKLAALLASAAELEKAGLSDTEAATTIRRAIELERKAKMEAKEPWQQVQATQAQLQKRKKAVEVMESKIKETEELIKQKNEDLGKLRADLAAARTEVAGLEAEVEACKKSSSGTAIGDCVRTLPEERQKDPVLVQLVQQAEAVQKQLQEYVQKIAAELPKPAQQAEQPANPAVPAAAGGGEGTLDDIEMDDNEFEDILGGLIKTEENDDEATIAEKRKVIKQKIGGWAKRRRSTASG